MKTPQPIFYVVKLDKARNAVNEADDSITKSNHNKVSGF